MPPRRLEHPAVQHTLYEWGMALAIARRGQGLSRADVARLVGLGERLTADDVQEAEAGRRSYWHLGEISEALGLGVRVELVPAEKLTSEWSVGTRERLRRARAAALLEMPAQPAS